MQQRSFPEKKRPSFSTVKALEALRPEAEPYAVKDAATPGLWLKVWPSGARTFLLLYRHQGRSKKLTIGPVTLAEARKKAREARNLRDEGIDPAAAKKAARDERKAALRQAEREAAVVPLDEIETVVASFVARHHKANRSWRAVSKLFQKEIVEPWRGRRLSEIGKADIYELLDKITDRPAPVLANRIFAHLRGLCRWALARGLIERDPTAGLSRPYAGEESRERVLSDAELALVWKASDALGYPFGPFVKLLILTGQRRGEISGGRWSEIDLNAKTWNLPSERTKNGRPHVIPLAPQACALLESLPRIGSSPLVFTTTSRSSISGFSRTKRALDKRIAELNGGAAAPPWTLHDLRRSAASGLARIGVALHVIEKILNHQSGSFGGIVSVYQHHQYEPEKRAALERWAAHIDRILTGAGGGNVVPLRRADEVQHG